MKRLLATLVVCLASIACFGQAGGSTVNCPAKFDSKAITVSGTVIPIQNDCGGKSGSFSYIITGSPATMSAVLNGCMRPLPSNSGTAPCTGLNTYTGTTSSIVKPTIDAVYDYFTVTPTWTGGTSPTFGVSSTVSTANSTGTGGGLADPGANGPMKRTALNTTAPATASDMVALWAGGSCSGFLKNDATCSAAGTGDIVGPGSSVSDHFAIFSGTTGKLLKDSLATPAAIATSGSATDLIAGTVPAARLPNPSSTTLGGVQSITATATQFVDSISTSGVPNKRALVSADVPNNAANTSGLAGTATALAANGTNCSAGQLSAGVDASGNAEGCTPAGAGTMTSSGPPTANQVPIFSSGTNLTGITLGAGEVEVGTGSTPISKSGPVKDGRAYFATPYPATPATQDFGLAVNNALSTIGGGASVDFRALSTTTELFSNTDWFAGITNAVGDLYLPCTKITISQPIISNSKQMNVHMCSSSGGSGGNGTIIHLCNTSGGCGTHNYPVFPANTITVLGPLTPTSTNGASGVTFTLSSNSITAGSATFTSDMVNGMIADCQTPPTSCSGAAKIDTFISTTSITVRGVWLGNTASNHAFKIWKPNGTAAIQWGGQGNMSQDMFDQSWIDGQIDLAGVPNSVAFATNNAEERACIDGVSVIGQAQAETGTTGATLAAIVFDHSFLFADVSGGGAGGASHYCVPNPVQLGVGVGDMQYAYIGEGYSLINNKRSGGPQKLNLGTLSGKPGHLLGPVWIDGENTFTLDYAHCEYQSADCVEVGALHPVTGFTVGTIDSANNLGGSLIHFHTGTLGSEVQNACVGEGETKTIIQDDNVSPTTVYASTGVIGTSCAPFYTQGAIVMGTGQSLGLFTTKASATGSSGLNIPHGAAPTSPVNGDFWSTTSGFFGRVNGSTVGPFTASGGSVWSSLSNPSGNLSLTMGSNTSIFNTTSALSQLFGWKNTTAAVVGTSQGSPVLVNCGRAFHGSADVEDCMYLSELPGNGNDAAITFNIGHTGSSTGLVTTQFPGPIASGANGGLGGAFVCPEGTVPTGIASSDIAYCDSTAHRIKAINNNGTATTYGLFTDNLSVFAAGGAIAPASLTVSGLGLGIMHSSSGGAQTSSAVDLSSADATGVMAAGRMPALTGAVTNSSGSLATSPGKIDVTEANGDCLDAGANDTYACNLSPAITAYVTGINYCFKANTANTGAATINFNAIGALTIKKPSGGSITTDLADNDIRAGQWVCGTYDATNYQMTSQLGNTPGAVSSVFTRTGAVVAANNDYSEDQLSGAAAAKTLTETGASNSITRAGVATANSTAPDVFQNTNSTNNNTSIGVAITTPGTSTGQVTLNVNGATSQASLVDFTTGATYAAGVQSGATIVGSILPTGAYQVKGTTAGFHSWTQGSTSSAIAPCNAANTFCLQAPAALTAGLETIAPALAQGMPTRTGVAATIQDGFSGDAGHSAVVTIGSGTSIGSTSLCSTALCLVGTYRVNVYLDITTACGTSGTYSVSLVYTDDTASKTIVVPLQGTGAAAGVVTTTSTNNFGQAAFILRSTGAASINYLTTAVACGSAGPMVGKLYLSTEPVQ